MTRRCIALAVLAILALSVAPAMAQMEVPVNVTAFTGVAMVPDAHRALGVAAGLILIDAPIRLEFEYGRTGSDPATAVPEIRTFAGNFHVQPRQPWRLQIYGTVGIGIYRMLLDHRSSEANDATNVGGGAKLSLVGPLKLRLDYRRFSLAAIRGQYHSNEHRFYAGITAGF